VAEALGDTLAGQGLRALQLIAAEDERTWAHLDGMARIALIGMRPPGPLLARVAAGALQLISVGAHAASASGVSHIRYAPHAGLAAALAALRSLGHRRIGHWQARAGALVDSGQGIDRDGGDLRRWLETESMTALVCNDAATAAWAVLAAHHSGFRVPDELSIVALEDHPILRVVSPSVTAFSEPIGEIVQALVHALVSGDGSTKAGPAFKGRVAVRASTGPPTPVPRETQIRRFT
jgi:DNA-binding LacI/PurR family transcriptional regulator